MSQGRGSYRKRQRIRKKLSAVEFVCWLCLQPLHWDVVDPRDPKFVVIDEELPVSKGGDPLDLNNCHLTCACCNLKKGDRILPRGAFADAGMRTAHGIARQGVDKPDLHIPRPSRKWI